PGRLCPFPRIMTGDQELAWVRTTSMGIRARLSGVSREPGCWACRILPKDHDRWRRPDLVRDKFDESPPAGFSRKLAISVADPQRNWRPAARSHDPVRMCQLARDAEPSQARHTRHSDHPQARPTENWPGPSRTDEKVP